MADMTMLLLTVNTRTGETVNGGDLVRDFRGAECVFVRADRATVPGKSGKVTVLHDGTERAWMNDNVFGLRVEGLLVCGCPHFIVWDEGHQAGCLRQECGHPDDQVHMVAGEPDYRQCFRCGEHLDEKTVH